MPFEDFQAAIAAARPSMLPEITSALWRAFGAGALDDSQVERLSGLIEARMVLSSPDRGTSSGTLTDRAGSPRKAVGSRPRTSDCLARRRRWAASGWMPPAIAAGLTTAEAAGLAVIAWQATRSGDCRLSLGQLAALAGIGRSSIKRAIRIGRTLGLIAVDERRIGRRRNDTNVIRIVSTAWQAWLRLRGPAGRHGVQSGTGRNTEVLKPRRNRPSAAGQRLPKDRDRPERKSQPAGAQPGIREQARR